MARTDMLVCNLVPLRPGFPPVRRRPPPPTSVYSGRLPPDSWIAPEELRRGGGAPLLLSSAFAAISAIFFSCLSQGAEFADPMMMKFGSFYHWRV